MCASLKVDGSQPPSVSGPGLSLRKAGESTFSVLSTTKLLQLSWTHLCLKTLLRSRQETRQNFGVDEGEGKHCHSWGVVRADGCGPWPSDLHMSNSQQSYRLGCLSLMRTLGLTVSDACSPHRVRTGEGRVSIPHYGSRSYHRLTLWLSV